MLTKLVHSMPQYEQERAVTDARGRARPTHLGRTCCVLCGEVAKPGQCILGPLAGSSMVAACEEQSCVQCEYIVARYPDHCWFHDACWSTAHQAGHSICVKDVAVKILWESVVGAIEWPRMDSPEEKAEMIGERLAGMKGTHLEMLPIEILTMVGHYLVDVDLAEFRSLDEALRLYEHAQYVCNHGDGPGRETDISLNGPVYMALTRFHGTAYICGMANTPFTIDHHLVLGLAKKTTPREPRMLLLGCNQNGVGDIQFLESREDRIQINKHPWYKLIRLWSKSRMSVCYNVSLVFLIPAIPCHSYLNRVFF